MDNLRQGLEQIVNAIEEIANRPTPLPTFNNNDISGDKIHGGTITKFSSVGIKDDATKLVLLVKDNGVHVDSLRVAAINSNPVINGNLDVQGEITAHKLHVNEITADVRNERSTPLEFLPDANGLNGKGLLWKSDGPTKQFTFRSNPDRIWSSENIDIDKERSYNIGNVPVLMANELGNSIKYSNLIKVGTLQNLRTSGDLVIDEFIHYSGESQRIGFGTEAPNANISVTSFESEFIIDVEQSATRIGTWTTDDLQIVTDNTPRITVAANGTVRIGQPGGNSGRLNVFGKLGVGVNNVPEGMSLSVSEGIQLQGRKIFNSDNIPTEGNYRLGDIAYNTKPQPTGYVGWVCVIEGSPGVWRPFGQIAS